MLTIPEEKKNLEPVNFSVEAGLVHRLGEESVSDPVLAVVELIKNSYDEFNNYDNCLSHVEQDIWHDLNFLRKLVPL